MRIVVQIFCALTLLAFASEAQTIPQIQLQQVYPKLKMSSVENAFGDSSSSRVVWMSEAPDGSGRLFFVSQVGVIYVVKKGSDGSDAKEFLNITDRNPYFDNEDGLLSVAFHPGFKTNGLFYIYYTQENAQNQGTQPQNYPFRSIVSEMKVSATNPDKADTNSERILMQISEPYWNHKGGELCFGPDGYLYLGLGDGGPVSGNDPFGNGQNTATLLAKMLRIDVNTRGSGGGGGFGGFGGFGGNRQMQPTQYGIPSDNPFANNAELSHIGVRPEIFAYGLRNPWRYSFDKKTGDLWVGDVGQDYWEEIDLVTNGGNYGWSAREGAHSFKPGPANAQYSEPVMEYPHRENQLSQSLFPNHSTGLCVIGGYVYRGKKFPALDGIYIYGDYNIGTIWGFRYVRDTKKVTSQGMMLDQQDNINSFAEDADGEVYVLMQSGNIYMITSK